MCRKLTCLIIFALLVMVTPVNADTLSGLADVSMVDDAIVSLQYLGTEYVVGSGDLTLGTTTRWYIPADTGVETLWAEGDPAPEATVSGTSNPKDGDVGSKADNFLFKLEGSTNISSIDGVDFQQTIFPFPTDTFFLFERGGNDKGTWQAILADGSLGAEVEFEAANVYANTGVNVNGQNAYGVVFNTDVPVQGVRITVSGHDTLSISTPTGAEPAEPEPTIIVEAGGDIAVANAGAAAGDIIGIAAGTYAIVEAVEIKDGVTYRGAGSGQTIIDCGGLTRAFVGWGDRSQNDDLPYSDTGYPANTSGPKGWVIQGLSIINGVADDVGKSVLRIGDPAIDPPLTSNEVTDPLKSTNGGGILLENYAEGTLIDVAFDNCNALATGIDTTDPTLPTTYLGSGGALHMGWATANIVDCSFTGNNASNDGGAINATNPDSMNWDLSIESSTFTNNRCRDDGGAIAATRRNLSVINCVGDGNKTGLDPAVMADNAGSSPSGGFLYLTGAGKVEGTSYTDDTPPLEMTNYGGVVTVTGCAITNGEAVQRGGGIRSNGAAQLIVTDTSFTNCSALTDDGGAIFANSVSPFNPAALDPNNPNAPVGEPGVYLDGVTLDSSSAGDDGGGIKVDNYSPTSSTNYIEFPKVVINNSVVKNCRAGGPAPDDGDRDGGGIHVNNKLNLTITNTLIENCTAGRHAAGIKIDGIVNAALIDRCRISNCTNDDIGGEGGDGVAIYADSDENVGIMISNCIFNNNINMQDDGVFRIDAHEASFFNCTFVGNVTADQGIIRYATSEDDPSVQNGVVNCLFVNNDHSPGSDELIAHNKNSVTYTYTNNGFFGNVGDGDELIDTIPDDDLGLTANFIMLADPLVNSAAIGGDYHLMPGAEAIDAGTAVGAPDHDFDDAPRPQGAAHDVGAYEAPAN